MSSQTKHLKLNLSEQARKGLWFLIGIAGFYTLFWVIFKLAEGIIKKYVAVTSWVLLSMVKVKAELLFSQNPVIAVSGVNAEINSLCSGVFEIALIMAIVMASWDRSWKQRITGALGGALFVLLVNPLRIMIVLAVGHYLSWKAADLTHDILFRLSLLLIIIGYYYWWYVKATCEQS